METLKKFFIARNNHIDYPLLLSLALLSCYGFIILFSSVNQDQAILNKQLMRLGLASLAMLVLAQIPIQKYRLWSYWLYSIGLLLLFLVLIMGLRGKGAQRWLDLGLMHIQPSELMKLAVPMAAARYLSEKTLPPSFWHLIVCAILIGVPALLIAKQPDLGTAILIAGSGAMVLFLAGVRLKIILILLALVLMTLPFVWHILHSYQQQRVLTFLDPARDPLGSGYHIIQSKIALGSGGLWGKGWLLGTQSHLDFLPEHETDFIFAVCGEELGLVGSLLLLLTYLGVTARCLYITFYAQDTYARLLSGALSLNFFFAFFINMGMVAGILPVVGIPLPLVSYGGTSMVTLLASFGMLMSIHTHRTLYAK
jgi:rod shape determining protein RodA